GGGSSSVKEATLIHNPPGMSIRAEGALAQPIPPVLPPLLRDGKELHANAALDGDGIAGLFAKAGVGIELPHADLTAFLAGDEHPPAARVDVEVPGNLDVSGDVARRGELA